MPRSQRDLIGIMGVFLVAGCAGPKKVAFDYVPPPARVVYAMPATIFRVEDKRPYVIDGEKSADWVGFWRWYGIPFNVGTESRRPFADELNQALTRELGSLGFKVDTSSVLAGSEDTTLATALRTPDAGRGLAVVIEGWRANTNVNTSLEYRLRVRVVDWRGQRLAEETIDERAALPGSWIDPPSAMKKQVPAAFSNVVRRIVRENPPILHALAVD